MDGHWFLREKRLWSNSDVDDGDEEEKDDRHQQQNYDDMMIKWGHACGPSCFGLSSIIFCHYHYYYDYWLQFLSWNLLSHLFPFLYARVHQNKYT